MNTTEKINARKQRWAGFLDNKRRFVFLVHHGECGAPAALYHRHNRPKLLEHTRREYAKMLERLEWLDDDRVPCPNGMGVFTGTEIFAEAFGCRVHHPEDNMPFALPLVRTASEAAKIKVPDWGATPLAGLLEDAVKLRAEFGGDCVLKLPDMQSAMDVCALVWDKCELFPAMIEEPGAVKELAAKVKALIFAFMDEWFRVLGKAFIAHFPDYYMPFGLTVSEDEIGAVSPDMFHEFFLPDLVEMSQRYGALGIHCCAASRRQWDGFLKIPNLKILNLGPSGYTVNEAYEFFAPHLAQFHGCRVTLDPGSDLSHLPQGTRAVVEASAATRDDALRLAEKLAKLCG